MSLEDQIEKSKEMIEEHRKRVSELESTVEVLEAQEKGVDYNQLLNDIEALCRGFFIDEYEVVPGLFASVCFCDWEGGQVFSADAYDFSLGESPSALNRVLFEGCNFGNYPYCRSIVVDTEAYRVYEDAVMSVLSRVKVAGLNLDGLITKANDLIRSGVQRFSPSLEVFREIAKRGDKES